MASRRYLNELTPPPRVVSKRLSLETPASAVKMLRMRRDLFTKIAILAVCLMGIVCPNVKPETVSSSEAQTVARRIADRKFMKCGQYYYSSWEGGKLRQYDQLVIRFRPRVNTRSDVLNGIQLQGSSTITYASYKEYEEGKWGRWQGSGFQGWKEGYKTASPSTDDYLRGAESLAYIVKRNGRWAVNKTATVAWPYSSEEDEITVDSFLSSLPSAPSCESVPK
jgi:hypothetical protein